MGAFLLFYRKYLAIAREAAVFPGIICVMGTNLLYWGWKIFCRDDRKGRPYVGDIEIIHLKKEAVRCEATAICI